MKAKLIVDKSFEPVLHLNIPEKDYHEDLTKLNSTSLKWIFHSEKAWYHDFHKEYAPPKSEALEFGKLIHKIVLEGSDFLNRYVVMPTFEAPTLSGEMSTRSKAALQEKKEWIDEQQKNDRIICTQDDYDRARWMIDSFLNHKHAFNLIKNGYSESTVHCAHPETGILMRTRADFFSPSDGVLVDLKTCLNISHEYFKTRRVIHQDFRYDLQIGMYKNAYELYLKKPLNYVAWIVLQNTKPFECAVYNAEKDFLLMAEEYYDLAVRKIHRALKNNKFKPYQEEMMPLIFTEREDWYFKNIEFVR